jgi:hypothetical protein
MALQNTCLAEEDIEVTRSRRKAVVGMSESGG